MPVDAAYSWADSQTIQTFFIIVSAIAVPIWVFRLAKRLRERLSSGAAEHLSLSNGSARTQSFLAEEQQDR